MEDDQAPLPYEIDWSLDQQTFRNRVREMIRLCQKKGKVIALPIELKGSSAVDMLILIVSQVNCDGCDAPCCRSNPKDEPIGILPSEQQYLAGKYGKDNFIADGIRMPCPFLKGKLCRIYSERPLACVLFPFQPGGYFGDENTPTMAVASTCPEGRRIARQVYMWSWKIRGKFLSMTKEDFVALSEAD